MVQIKIVDTLFVSLRLKIPVELSKSKKSISASTIESRDYPNYQMSEKLSR